MTRRIYKDLSYLVKTTDKHGERGHDVAMFGERESRLVEHGWVKEKYGESTERGERLSQALQIQYGTPGGVEDVAMSHGVENVIELAEREMENHGL